MNTKRTRNQNGDLHSFNDEPAITHSVGSKYWYHHGKLHRDNDQPAVIYDDGAMYWYQHGKHHRETDAAIITASGYKEYWLNGHYYTFEGWIKITPISEEDKLALLLEK